METRVALLACVLELVLVPCHVTASPSNARFLGVGYNLLSGNPDGGMTSRGGIDPGLLYTRKIFDVTNPHAIQSESRSSCARVKSTSVFYGAKSYQDKLKLGVSIGGGANVGIDNFAFSLSPRFEKTRHETTNEHKIFQDDQVTCNLGRQRWADELAHAYSLAVTDNFAAAVCGLLSYYNKHQYMAFLDQWGTHVTTEVELGYKNISRYQSSLTSFVEFVSQQSSLDVQAGGAYMGYGASLSVDFQNLKASSKASTDFGTFQTVLNTGSPSLPEPIGLKVVPIYETLAPSYWQNSTRLTSQKVCTRSDLQDLTSIQSNLKQAVADYAAYRQAVQPTDPELRIPLAWPRGTYGLYKARTGCPTGGFTWFHGYRYQDSEDYNTHNTHSTNLHLAGSVEADGDIETEFCIKGKRQSTDFDLEWPKGDYCVLKYGDCPKDFHQGWIKWDDEDDRNTNSYAGYLPDGVYDQETLLYFCCRNDSLPTMAMNLPNDKPFYLLRHSRSCQRVRGMAVSEEFVSWDEEWHLFVTKNHKYGGYHPFDDGDHDNHKLHFCYYTPLHGV